MRETEIPSTTPSATPPSVPPRRRWLRRAVWAVGGLVGLWGLGWLAVPPLLKHQAQKVASEALGRTVRIGAVDFRPWSLELTVHDLAVASADGGPDQLQVKRLYMDAELQSLLRLAPVVDAIAVEAPVVRLAHRGGGRYDIDDVLAKLAQPKDAAPADKPLQFALYNLSLTGGVLEFADADVQRTHRLSDLRIEVPFLSNLASKREIKTEPRLAFRLNGSSFDSAADATPFAANRKTEARFKLTALDLKPYLGYLPASLPVRLRAGVLDADLKLSFEQNPQPAVRLSGSVQAGGVDVGDRAQQDLLAFDALRIDVADLRPLARSVKLSTVTVAAPVLRAHRARDGRLNLDLAPSPSETPKKIAKEDRSTLGNGQKDAKKAPPDAWTLEVGAVAVQNGRVAWSDDSTSVGKGGVVAQAALQGLQLDATGIALDTGGPTLAPVAFRGSAALVGGAARTAAVADTAARPASGGGTAALAFSGTASHQAASVTATVQALPLALAAPYVAQFLEPTLTGTLQATLGLNWQAGGAKAGADALALRLDRLALERVALNAGRSELAAVRALELTGSQIDLPARSVTLGRLVVTQPRLMAGRDANGRLMAESWLRKPAADSAKPAAAPAAAPAAPDWKLELNDLLVTGGTVGWADAATPRPVAVELSALRLQLRQFTLDGRKPATLDVSARLGAGAGEPGQLAYRGTLGHQPLAAQGSVELLRLPVHAFEPYFGDALNIELLRADSSFKGTVRYTDTPAGPQLQVAGDAAVEDFRANSVPGSATSAAGRAGTATAVATATPTATATADSAAALTGAAADPAPQSRARLRLGEELLNWKALSLRGIDVSLAPGATTTVAIQETALSDFYARVIIRQNGRINLQDMVKSAPELVTATATMAANSSKTVANNDLSALGNGQKASQNTAPAAAGPSGPAPVIRFGPVSLVNGRVNFSDRFIQPNYTADLTELTGRLSAFSSVSPDGSPQLADLELRGRAEGTASLEVLGKINPLAKPLALDIRGKVRDLELPPLSPYTIKYAGHGIERGKLSVDVAYRIQPDGQLTASNQVILNQLRFGDKVEGAPASLPVKLAVALLADRNGVIDINLPVSGSLNDPQFRLGPIIFKVIVNLVVKAITSPFSLLASAFGGGGDELSQVTFAPGSAVLTPQAAQTLDKVAKALADRPALTMSVVGTAALEAEREAFKRERLQGLLVAEKRRAQVVAGSNGTATVTVSPAEAPELLKAVYKRADMPKPRNLVGMVKDIPQPEMEALLLASIAVSEERMRELATARAVAVRDYLAGRQLPLERLFLGAPRTGVDKPATPGAAAAAPWTPRAELSLTTR